MGVLLALLAALLAALLCVALASPHSDQARIESEPLNYLLEHAEWSENIGGLVYWMVAEYWWASPAHTVGSEVCAQALDLWRSRGYYARMRYREQRSGVGWNNSPNDQRQYRVLVALKPAQEVAQRAFDEANQGVA